MCVRHIFVAEHLKYCIVGVIDDLKAAMKEKVVCEERTSFVLSTLCVCILDMYCRGHEEKLCPLELTSLFAQGFLL